jgi:hypothetical protein
MKRLAIISAMLLFSVSVFSNPLPPPPVISELYWDESGWTMELYFLMAPYEINNLDELLMVCNGDTSAFNPGIPVELWQIIVVTSEDLVEPMDIPVEGGMIQFFYTEDLWPINDGFVYGNYPSSRVTAVEPGQSLVTQKFITIDERGMEFWVVKEMQPSIGTMPFTCQTRANFSGLVLDKAGLAVPDASIIYTYTDTENFDPPIPEIITGEEGTFSTDQMFCREYSIKVYVDGQMELITQVNIEPGSANYYEFALDSLYVGTPDDLIEQKVSMSAGPNPFNQKLHIYIEMDQRYFSTPARLKLVDLKGNILKSTDVHSPYLHNVDIYWEYLDQVIVNPGIYLLMLEVEGDILATQKVVFQQ